MNRVDSAVVGQASPKALAKDIVEQPGARRRAPSPFREEGRKRARGLSCGRSAEAMGSSRSAGARALRPPRTSSSSSSSSRASEAKVSRKCRHGYEHFHPAYDIKRGLPRRRGNGRRASPFSESAGGNPNSRSPCLATNTLLHTSRIPAHRASHASLETPVLPCASRDECND